MKISSSPFTLLFGATIIVSVFVFFFFGIYTVEGRSMMPNLLPGRNVIILKHFPADSIHPGDIIVYKSPVDGTLVIKRCAGTGGDKIMNGNFAVLIPPRTIFAIGDNLDRSKDSRHYGAVPLSAIKGKVIFPGIGGSKAGE